MAGKPGEASRGAQDKAPPRYDGIANPFPPSVLPNLRQPPRLDPYVTIAGQRYKQVDDGRANVLVPAPLTSPAELAQQRAAIERALFMARNPLAGAAFGVAALAGASPRVRDMAMATGGAVDAVMHGAAPFGSRARAPLQPPSRQPPVRASAQEPIRTQPANSTRQAMGANATVSSATLGTGKPANQKLDLPGRDKLRHDLGHLVSEGMGGRADVPAEAMALHRWANRGPMAQYEKSVIGRARRGEVVEYFVKPLYKAPAAPPSSVVLSAQGSRGGFTPKIISNRPRPPK